MNWISLSVVVPVYDEEDNIRPLYDALKPVLRAESGGKYEIVFVDDGSTDTTSTKIAELHKVNKRVKLLSLSRNFGKEVAIAAGIAAAAGEAIMTLDGDGQHPVDRIPDFVAAWKNGAQVVIGVRKSNSNEGWVKKYGSKLFYTIMNHLSGVNMVPGSSDFRLVDRAVQREFIRLDEPGAMTRGLIDWLGFKREYVEYAANPRFAGDAGYKFRKLFKLAANSFVSLSPTPLYAFGYLGLFITGTSFILGLSILIEQILLGDPLKWEFTGTAMLSVLVLFLVGLVLVSQGVLALYISAIHSQTKGRPLYIVNYRESLGLVEKA
jgi:glycosyltransferase involved in cell wall biosynthesis